MNATHQMPETTLHPGMDLPPPPPSLGTLPDMASDAGEDIAALTDLANTTFDLIEAMEEETRMLRQFRVGEAAEVMARKKQLCDLYTLKNETLRTKLGDRRIELDPDTRDAITRLAQRMKEAADENATVIRAAQDANQMFIDVMRESLSKEAHPVSTYGRNGRQTAPSSYQQRAIPVYSDRRL